MIEEIWLVLAALFPYMPGKRQSPIRDIARL